MSALARLRTLSETMVAESPVFIIGAPRSGTSLLYRILQGHSDFRPRTLNLEETAIFQQLWRLPFFGDRVPSSLFRYMLEDEDSYSAFLATIRPLRALATLLLIPNVLLRHRAGWWWRHVNRSDLVLRAYFYFAKRARGCNLIVEKTPENWRFIDGLLGAFPRCRMLYLCRHPVEQFASYRRRAKDDADAGWAALSVGDFCVDYLRSTQTVLRAQQSRRAPLLLVHYEELTSNTEEAFHRICDFLGVPFEPEALRGSNPERIRWPADPHLFGDVRRQTKVWQELVSPLEAVEIEERLTRVMGALGYQSLIA